MDSIVAGSPFGTQNRHRGLAGGVGQRFGQLRKLLIQSCFGIYRFLFGPALRAFGGLGHECRFEPSCSHYSEQAFARFSFLRATQLSLHRLLRCHPWSEASTFDPLPEIDA